MAREPLGRVTDVGGRRDREDAPVERLVGAFGMAAPSTEEAPSEIPSAPTLVAPSSFNAWATAIRSSPSFQPPLEGASFISPVSPKLRRSTAATLNPHS